MKKRTLMSLLGALLLVSTVALGQEVTHVNAAEEPNKKELASRMSQDPVFREYTVQNRNYLKVVDEWLASLTPEQQKARKEGALMMPEFYTDAERQQHYQQQIRRMDEISARFPEVRQLSERERQWVRSKATSLVLKEYKK